MSPRSRRKLAFVLALALASAGCSRGVEPFDPNEKVAAPDLSKIFPPGAERAPQDGPMGRPPRGAPPPGAPAPGMPGAAAGAAAEASAPSDAQPIRGRIVLSEELAGRVPRGAVLFLVARSAETGPPVAVVRVVDPSFPLEFEIGPDDRMMEGIPFTGPFQLTARVDADQNAATRNPGDLQGQTPSRIAPGANDVELVIDQVL